MSAPRLFPRDGDLWTLAALHAESFADTWSAPSIGQLLVTPGTFAFVGEEAGREAGFILVRAGAGEAEILTLAVAPAARRRGMGAALVAAAARHAQDLGAAAMFLEVAASNAPARALYEKLGFAAAGIRKAYYRIPGTAPEDAHILRAQLPLWGLGNVAQPD